MCVCLREVINAEQYLSTSESESAHLSVTELDTFSSRVIYSLIHCLRGSLTRLLTQSLFDVLSMSICSEWTPEKMDGELAKPHATSPQTD